MRRLSISMLLLVLPLGLAVAGLVQMNIGPGVPVPPVHTGSDADIYYLESYPGAGSYDIDSGWYQAGLWNTDAITEPYQLEQISWYGYLFYAQDFDFYIAPADGSEPGTATYVGTTYDASVGSATWHTHILDTPYPVLPGQDYYLIMMPLSYSASGYWWCSNTEVTDPHASMTSTDLSTWVVDYQTGGYEYLAAVWAEGEAGGSEDWYITYSTFLTNDEAVNHCGVPIGASINNNTGAAVSKNLYVTTNPPSQYLPLGTYTFEVGENTWYGCIPVNNLTLPSGNYDLLIEVGDTPTAPDATDDFSLTLLDPGLQ